MAKKGLLGRLITAVIAGAAIGSACYIFRDKIRESKLYTGLNIDGRLAQLKALFKKEEEDFAEEDDYIFHTADKSSSDRTYVSLDTAYEASDDTEQAAAENSATEETDSGDLDNADSPASTAYESDGEENSASMDYEPDEEESSASMDYKPGEEESSASMDYEPDEEEGSASMDYEPDEEEGSASMDYESDEGQTSEEPLAEDSAPENAVPTIAVESIGDIYDAAVRRAAEEEAAARNEIQHTPTGYDMEGLSDVSEDPEVLMEQDMLDEAPFSF